MAVFGCGFVAEAANVVLVGGVGTGKTHLAIALGMACCQGASAINCCYPALISF